MDRRSSLARAAAQGLLSGLGAVACSTTPATVAAPLAPDPSGAGTSALPSRVAPPPPPLPGGSLRAAPQPTGERACCAGKNMCKGQGGCANAQHECAGRNECKGTGTACPPEPQPGGGGFVGGAQKNCCMGLNDCKGKSACAVTGKHACRGQNQCKGQGSACLPTSTP